MSNGPYILALDNGTSVDKAALFDMHGTEVATAAHNTPVLEERPGWSEFDMDTDWKETAGAIKEVIAKAGISPGAIRAVGIGGKGVGCCFVDSKVRPLRNAILWNDARAVPLMEKWIANGMMDEMFEITGNWLMPGDMGLLLPWLAEHEPEVLDRTSTILLPTGWIAYQLTGKLHFNRADVYSQLDIRSGTYSGKVLELEGISKYRRIFPELGEPWDVIGEVSPRAAEETGLAPGTPVVLLGWDVVACTMGVGAIEEGQANIILGTSGVIEAVLRQPSFTPKQMGLQSIHAVPERWLQLIAPMHATPHVDWWVDEMGGADRLHAKELGKGLFDLLEEEVAKVPVGSGGLIYHPYIAATGERAPFHDPNAKVNFFGIGLHSDRYHMLRAIYEGIAFSNKHCLDAYVVKVTDVRLSGGGSKSPVWSQIFADAFNMTVSIPSGSELGAKGAAWNAAFAVGLFPSREEAVREFCQVERVYEPSPRAAAQYAELYELYKDIVPRLSEPWAARARFLERAEATAAPLPAGVS
ncbi:MAG: FGGY-family carbohydrate kinase [Candidatus Dormiibacterota bacterium]|jgi:sugar (pentulose or hexulose) kinase